MKIREFREGDDEDLIALWELCGLTRPWNDPAQDISAACSNPSSAVFVLEEDQRLIGSVMVGYDGHRGWIYYLCVHPAHRGGGLGRQLMDRSELWLRERGAAKLQLMVRAENEAAVAFYTRLGLELQPVVTLGRRLDGEDARPQGS